MADSHGYSTHWRFASRLAFFSSPIWDSLNSDYLLCRLATFNSPLLALISAGLMSIDGLHLVMSRTALLDIFLMFFLLSAFLALLYERHLVAALLLGLALGTKWSAVYFIVALGIYIAFTNRKRLLLTYQSFQ